MNSPATLPADETADPQALWFLRNLAIIHAATDQTNGRYAITELTGAPGDMPPLHVHPCDDEGFYVLDGALRLHVGDRILRVQAGQFALAPRGIPHAYVVESETPARWLAISNGGFDRFIADVSVPATAMTLPPAPSMPPPEELAAIARRHGIELLGPPGALPAPCSAAVVAEQPCAPLPGHQEFP
ncbi:MAG TPA: cupin domain-containing protein [Streptosporangiaceae bacterium]